MECDGTRKRTGGEVKGKKANGVGSQQSCTVSDTVYPALLPLMRTPRLPAADWTDTPADINGLVRFAGKPNLVSACVPSRFVSALPVNSSLLTTTIKRHKKFSPFHDLIPDCDSVSVIIRVCTNMKQKLLLISNELCFIWVLVKYNIFYSWLWRIL